MDTRTNTQTGAKVTFDEYLEQCIENFEGPDKGEGDEAKSVTRGLVQLLRVAQAEGPEAMVTAILTYITAAMSALALVTGSRSDAVGLMLKIVGKHGLDFLAAPSYTKGTPQ